MAISQSRLVCWRSLSGSERACVIYDIDKEEEGKKYNGT
jgi:hypothetical protein